ncbi:hypothetical protein CPC08DRAFT_823851 [Agrocybe pediades]|nr:hypothetical protein CPC08DRAFT_823851 [Agrocybe pediades]
MARSGRKKSKSQRKESATKNLDDDNSHSLKSKGEGSQKPRKLTWGPGGKGFGSFNRPKNSKAHRDARANKAAEALSRTLKKPPLQRSFLGQEEGIKSDQRALETAEQKRMRVLPRVDLWLHGISPSTVLRVKGTQMSNAKTDGNIEEEHDELDDEDEDEDEVRRAALHKIKVEWGLAQPIEVPTTLPLVDVVMGDDYGGEEPMDISDDEPGDDNEKDGKIKEDGNVIMDRSDDEPHRDDHEDGKVLVMDRSDDKPRDNPKEDGKINEVATVVSTPRSPQKMVRQDINNLAVGEKWNRGMSPPLFRDPKKRSINLPKTTRRKRIFSGVWVSFGYTGSHLSRIWYDGRSTSKQKANKPDEKDDKRTREPNPPPQQPDTHGKQVHRDDIIVRIAVRQMEEKGIKLDLSRLS